MSLAEKRGMTIPPKDMTRKISLDFKWVQNQRMKVRKLGLIEWAKHKDSNLFDAMSKDNGEIKRRTKYIYIRIESSLS